VKWGVCPVAPRSAAFVQVEGVKGEAAVGEVIGEVGVEEVVGIAVHRQYRAPGGARVDSPHKRRDQVALAVGVGTQFDGGLQITG